MLNSERRFYILAREVAHQPEVLYSIIDVAELDRLCQDVLNQIGRPPYDRLLLNLSQQQFSQRYQAVRQLL